MPYLSLIIPIYNAVPFLDRCLQSVLAQTYSDYELLLIDDGSTDESYSLCQNYAAADHRIRLFHQQNQGVASARNFGLRQAAGQYICWCDADDELLPSYLQGLVDDLAEGDYDLVMQGIMRIAPDSTEHVFPAESKCVFRLPADANHLFRKVNVRDYGVSFAKLFKRDLIFKHGLSYSDSILLAEDLDFLLRYLVHSHSVVVSIRCNYHYYLREGSVSHRIYSYQQELSGLRRLSSSWYALQTLYPSSEALTHQLSISITDYVHRLILSCYQRPVPRRTERLRLLHEIPSDAMAFYCVTSRPTFFLNCISRLFALHYYSFADLILRIRLSL